MRNFHKSVLKNGITVVTETHHQSRAVALGVWIQAGTRDEQIEEAGISHLLEHLVFKGTKKRTAFQIAKSLEAVGGDLNAYTTKEYTCYHALVLKEHQNLALDVLADLVCNMKLKRRDFMRERGVVLQEIAMTEDIHEETVHDAFFKSIYPQGPLGRPILGTVKSIAEMTQSQVNQYYKENYCGSNIIISAAGAISHPIFVEQIEKLFRSKVKGNPRGRKASTWKRTRSVIEKDSEQVHVLFGIPSSSYRDPKRFSAAIVNTLLGGGMTSRLFQAVREKRGLAYSVYSLQHSFTDSGVLQFYAAVDPENVKGVLSIMQRELKKLKKEKLTQATLNFYKTQLIGSILLGSEDMESRMTSLAVNEMIFKKYRSVDDVINDIRSIELKEINRFIKDSMDLKQISGVLQGPDVNQLKEYWEELEFE